jgi:hypothetical protein
MTWFWILFTAVVIIAGVLVVGLGLCRAAARGDRVMEDARFQSWLDEDDLEDWRFPRGTR